MSAASYIAFRRFKTLPIAKKIGTPMIKRLEKIGAPIISCFSFPGISYRNSRVIYGCPQLASSIGVS